MTTNPQPEWLERLRNWLSTDVVPAIALADLNAALAVLDRIYFPPQDVREAVEREVQSLVVTYIKTADDTERDTLIAFYTDVFVALITEREAALLTSVQEDIDHAEHLRDEMASRAHEAIAQVAGLRAQLEDKIIDETKEAMALGGNPDDWPTGTEFIARTRLEAERDDLTAKLERAREMLKGIKATEGFRLPEGRRQEIDVTLAETAPDSETSEPPQP